MSKILIGKVISTKMNKTAVVSVDRTIKHAKYGKRLITNKHYFADIKNKKVEVGNRVTIEESRPISKYKKFVIKEVHK